jgi:DNA-binding NarL/FixJ family response regulator
MMGDRIPVLVYAHDPISRAGVATQLRSRPEVRVVDDGELDSAAVAVVVAEEADGDAVRLMKSVQRNGRARVVLVLSTVDDAGLYSAVEGGASALLRRSQATTDALVLAVRSAAAGEGTVPPDLLGRLLAQVGRLHEQVLGPRGLTLAGLTQREIDVLKLVADGLSTGEIAHRLSYSERTIKNVIHDVTARFHLRNRSHAVAYAMRAGLI